MEMCLNLNNAKDPMPTQRMLDAARFAEDILCVDLPDNWNSSFFICSNFLDKYLDEAKGQYAEEAELYDMYHEFNYHDYVNDTPKEGQRKYYADAICKYDGYNKRYVDEREYDKTINDYGSYANKASVETSQRRIEETKINAYWSDWSYD